MKEGVRHLRPKFVCNRPSTFTDLNNEKPYLTEKYTLACTHPNTQKKCTTRIAESPTAFQAGG